MSLGRIVLAAAFATTFSYASATVRDTIDRTIVGPHCIGVQFSQGEISYNVEEIDKGIALYSRLTEYRLDHANCLYSKALALLEKSQSKERPKDAQISLLEQASRIAEHSLDTYQQIDLEPGKNLTVQYNIFRLMSRIYMRLAHVGAQNKRDEREKLALDYLSWAIDAAPPERREGLQLLHDGFSSDQRN